MLHPRLTLACQLYRPCELAADIGTDHALLPAELLLRGTCRRMILTDLSESALNRARQEMQRRQLTHRVSLRLGDGLQPLREPVEMISVLGMGGRTIAGILTKGRDNLRGASLLLSAHTDLFRVRLAVAEVGYHLVSETPCPDDGRYYLLLRAEPGAEALTPREARSGKRLMEADPAVLLPYLRHRREVSLAKLRGLEKAGRTDEALLAQVREDVLLDEAAIGKVEGYDKRSDLSADGCRRAF